MNMLRAGCLFSLTFALLSTPANAVSADPDGAALYKKKCSICHGKSGVPPKAFAKQGVKNHQDTEWQKATTDEEIRRVIVEGAKGTMMRAFRKEFSSEEVEALVKHVRALGKQQ